MKKLALFISALIIVVAAVITCPGKQAHSDAVTCKDHKKVVSVGVSNHDFTDSEQQVKDYFNKSINSDGNQ
jgi:hypothetical protein